MTELKVYPPHLEKLATDQETAAGHMASARTDANEPEGEFLLQHGPVCGVTYAAFGVLQDARNHAAELTRQISLTLAANLREAAEDYREADEKNGENLDTQMLPR